MIFRRLRKHRGQAAVEAMYAIPVMLIVYLIGAQMWSITWNAQYAHIKARHEAHVKADHKPCFSNNGQQLESETVGNANATTRSAPLWGGRFPTLRQQTMKAKYTIVCG